MLKKCWWLGNHLEDDYFFRSVFFNDHHTGKIQTASILFSIMMVDYYCTWNTCWFLWTVLKFETLGGGRWNERQNWINFEPQIYNYTHQKRFEHVSDQFLASQCMAQGAGLTSFHCVIIPCTLYKASSIYKHCLAKHNGQSPTLADFKVLAKCSGKFDCLVNEMLYIRLHKPDLNVQGDSIQAKVFV